MAAATTAAMAGGAWRGAARREARESGALLFDVHWLSRTLVDM